ncbi:hypothetical protein CLIB1423_06S04786 [[Candida] railenensis]|uniref:UEV domain-containing protein n=1 Tax=[Candida] railenensis TaxID=45579 RepID=A0A9P0QP95_9ASCO|nr:hypothetical protein CLIB1423_06S04786 [[Candida] railenensis]
MTELPASLSNWLYNVVQPQYANKQLTYTHLYQFLQVHYGKNLRLRVRTSVHTSQRSGQSTLLLNIFGSIPVTTTQLSVQIQIWIPLHYPFGNRESTNTTNDDTSGVPMIYIIPDTSNGILIKPGNHVDSSGRFYHPYLSNWYHESIPSGSGSRKYNLIELMKILQASFEKDCPIMVQESSGIDSAPSLPSKVPLNGTFSQNASNTQLPAQLTGPPLPAKPQQLVSGSTSSTNEERAIPLKYQTPLPLPPISQYIGQPNAITPQGTGVASQTPTGQYMQLQSPPQEFVGVHSPRSYSSPTYSNSVVNSPPSHTPIQVHQNYNSSPRQPHASTTSSPMVNKTASFSNSNQNSFIDLIDEDRGSSSVVSSSASNEVKSLILENISKRMSSEAKDFSLVMSNKQKIEALYQQLSYHHKQAVANSTNLESHVKYISQQKASITQLNNELVSLEESNTSESKLVYTSTNNSIPLDELITPDSALVNQLYEVVSEIKATKDTIDLIGGNFRSEGELIKDSNMETAVRTVRTLAREMFWLELMKNEIAGIMNLS